MSVRAHTRCCMIHPELDFPISTRICPACERDALRAQVKRLEATLALVRDEIGGCLESDAKAFMAMSLDQADSWGIARHNQAHGYCLDRINEVLK